MSDGLIGSVTIAVETDKEQFRADMVEQARAVAKFAEDATQSASKAAGGLTSMADAASESTQQLNAQQKRLLEGLQRQYAAMQGGKVAALELKAAQMGIAERAAPMIAAMREFEAAQRSSSTASQVAAAAMATLAESEADAIARIRSMVSASLEKTAALKAEQAASLAVASAERERNRSASSGSLISFPAQNKSLQETADLVNEVNAALGSIGRGASGQKELQAQTDKLVSLWSQGRISAGQYTTALKQLDASELALVTSSTRAAAASDAFIAKLKEQAATAGMSASQLLEYRAAQLGVSADAAPFILQIAEGEKAMHGFSLQTGGARRELGVLARELARGDFGGATRSFSIFAERSGLIGTLLSPTALGIGAVGAALGTFSIAAYQAQKELLTLNAELVLTGGFAGNSSGDLLQLAHRMGEVNKNTGMAVEVLSTLVNSGKVSGKVLEAVGQAATNMSKLTGESAKQVADRFSNMSDSVVKFADEFDKRYHMLDLAVYEQITALEEHGKSQQAQELLASTIAHEAQRRIESLRFNLNDGQRAWEDIGNAALTAWTKMKSASLVAMSIEPVQQELAWRQAWKAGDRNADNFFGSLRDAFSGMDNDQRIEALAQKAKKIVADAQAEAEKVQTEASGKSAFSGLMNLSEQIDKSYKLKSALAGVQKQWDDLNKADPGLKNLRAADPSNPLLSANALDNLKEAERKKILGSGAKGNDNAFNEEIKRIHGLYQEQERALKMSIQGNKSQYDIGLFDTEQYLKADYEARKAALAKELALVEQQIEVAGKKKNSTALEEARNLKKKILDEDVANEQKYSQDLVALHIKSDRDVQAYVESLTASYRTRQQAIYDAIAGVGLGDAAREELNRMNQVQQEFDRASDTLRKAKEKGEAHGGINERKYDQELAALQENLAKRFDLERAYIEDLKQVQADGWNGAIRFVQNYGNAAANVASQVESVFGTAARGMEDAFARFATTGKLSFSDLAKSIIADIARMQARAAISGLFNFAISAAGSYFGTGSNPGTFDKGVQKFAAGGVFTNSIVSTPTNFNMGLMGEAGPEAIMPLARASDGSLGVRANLAGANGVAGAPIISIHVQVNSDGSSDVAAPAGYQQFAKDLVDFIDQRINRRLTRSQQDGGMFSRAAMGYM